MTNNHEHPADGPEQEITSDTPEFNAEMAERTVEPHGKHEAAGEKPVDSSSVTDTGPSEPETEEAAAGQPAEHEAPAKLERLQKILAQAGIASRRHAEELITQGRVQVNGQVVNVLGSKADPQRDHIRVDGKLLHGAERLRYFILNKPRGFVTTVTDPEGRPTVMQFFAKTGERLYPVGRLDYLSEGLLLVTNDGELANKLTRAASGVEKTYVVKVSGQPDEEQIERLRTGIAIDRGTAGKGDKVHTAPARIREIRQGDNPWYEVVLIEGRNRELRKMFEEIGHHVEKIRRVGYGPLVLDVEPGKIRELDAAEVEALRLTAEGKLKPRRPKASHMLPKDAGKPAEVRGAKPRRFEKRSSRPEGAKPAFEPRGQGGAKRPESKFGDRPKFGARPGGRFDKTERSGGSRPFRPAREGSQDAPPFRTAGDRSRGARPFAPARSNDARPFRPEGGRSNDARPFRPAGDRPKRFDQDKKRTGPKRDDFRQRPLQGKGAGQDAPRDFERRRPVRDAGFSERPKLIITPDDQPRGNRGREDRPRPSAANQDRPRESRAGRAPEQSGADRRGRDFRGAQRPSGAPSSRRDGPPRTFSGPEKRGPGGSTFRGDKRNAGGSASRGTKAGSSFRGASKPAFGSKPGGAKRSQSSFGGKRSSARPGGGGAKRPPTRPGGKRAPGGGPKRGPSRSGGKRPK